MNGKSLGRKLVLPRARQRRIRWAGKWCYRVRGNGQSVNSAWSNIQCTTVAGKPAVPVVAASDGDSASSIYVTWKPVPGATYYKLYRNTASHYAPHLILDNIAGSSHRNYDVTPGKYYYYRLRACNTQGCSDISPPNQGYAVLPRPVLNTINNTDSDGDFVVDWNPVEKAGTYRLEERLNNGSWSGIHVKTGSSYERHDRWDGEWCYRVRANGESVANRWTAPGAIPAVPAWACRRGRRLILKQPMARTATAFA